MNQPSELTSCSVEKQQMFLKSMHLIVLPAHYRPVGSHKELLGFGGKGTSSNYQA